MKVDVVTATEGDWMALYLNGVCAYQHHEIEWDRLLSLLNIEYTEHRVYVEDRLPDNLEDIWKSPKD